MSIHETSMTIAFVTAILFILLKVFEFNFFPRKIPIEQENEEEEPVAVPFKWIVRDSIIVWFAAWAGAYAIEYAGVFMGMKILPNMKETAVPLDIFVDEPKV